MEKKNKNNNQMELDEETHNIAQNQIPQHQKPIIILDLKALEILQNSYEKNSSKRI